MTKCPHCNEKMDFDFLNNILDKLDSGGVQFETIVSTECCSNSIKAINDLNTYYIISEPAKSDEKMNMIGAK